MGLQTSISKTWTCDRCGEKITLSDCSINMHIPPNWRVVQLGYNDYAENPGPPSLLCAECVLEVIVVTGSYSTTKTHIRTLEIN